MDSQERRELVEKFASGEDVVEEQGDNPPSPDDLQDISLPEPGDEVGWHELAERFLPLYLRAAKGEYEISPQQRQLLDKIMDRGFGKVGTQPDEAGPVGVVVLPVLYSDDEPVQVCPRCAAELEEKEDSHE